jgi:hypothetical protein
MEKKLQITLIVFLALGITFVSLFTVSNIFNEIKNAQKIPGLNWLDLNQKSIFRRQHCTIC